MNMDIANPTSAAGVPPFAIDAASFEVARCCDEATVVIAETSRSRVDVMQQLNVGSGLHRVLNVSHLIRQRPAHGITDSSNKRDAYSICVHLEAFSDFDIWRDGRVVPSCPMIAGSTQIADMRHDWRADIQSPFQVVNFALPRSIFDEVSDDESTSPVEGLRCSMRDPRPDRVLASLARALLPALVTPDQANALFADYAARTVTAHIARTYGVQPVKLSYRKGGLTPWQEGRAKDILQANLSGQVTLAELASACRLSCSQFSQAFKQSTGCPPHQWLLVQRVERAKDLILNSTLPLSQIALEAGFFDQSHLTRVFSRLVKTSPAAWRREQLS